MHFYKNQLAYFQTNHSRLKILKKEGFIFIPLDKLEVIFCI